MLHLYLLKLVNCKEFVLQTKKTIESVKKYATFERITGFTCITKKLNKKLEREILRVHFKHVSDHLSVAFPFP